MLSLRWLETRRAHWARLEELLARADRARLSSLSVRELRELTVLYRQIASDLSVAREDPESQPLAVSLNLLLGRAHNRIYATRTARARGALNFYRVTWPREFRSTLPFTALAALLFCALAAVGWVITLTDPTFPRFVLGGEMMDSIERREMWTHSILAMKPLAASGIMTNNLAVCFMTAAAGIFGGIGTIWLLWLNGLLLGVVGAACAAAGMSLQLWSFVAPHGALELPAIFIAGGAGLVLARGLLFPGILPRSASLARSGAQATRLMLGTIPLLVAAGLIEGFISPGGLPPTLKLLFGAAAFSILATYLWRGGRSA